MAHSVEARVPFLDHRIVEFAFRLPGEYKIRGAETRGHPAHRPPRRAAPGNRFAPDKIGFRPDPGITWAFASRNRDSLLASANEFEERWFERTALERLLAGPTSPRRPSSCSGG